YLLIFSTYFSVSFYVSSADHRDLHSFPTRRSSDLASHGRLKSAVVLRSTACFRMIGIRSAHPVSTSPSVEIISSGRRPRGAVTRSEEHTSELQSRGHLVCRLLLEKTKQFAPHPAPC